MRKILFNILKYSLSVFLFSNTYSQIADFSVDVTEGCNPLTVHFTNTGSTGSDYSFDWDYDGDGFTDIENPTHTFSNPNPNTVNGEYNVTFTVTNKNTLESNSITKAILVKLTPSAKLDIDTTNACVNGDVEFQTGFDPKESAIWNFGDGTFSTENISQYVYHAYKANGTYNVRFITFLQECSDTSDYVININGPIADFSMSQKDACKGDTIVFTIGSSPVDVSSYYWDISGQTFTNISSVSHVYGNSGQFVARLNLQGSTSNCMIDDTVNIVKIIAQFTLGENSYCDKQLLTLQSTSVGNDYNYWDLGTGKTATGTNTSETYNTGSYTIKLKVTNDIGCSDSTLKQIEVNDLPTLELNNDTTICEGREVKLNALSNADRISWIPSRGLNESDIFDPIAIPDSTITYYITVTDTNTGCRQFGQVHINVLNQSNTENIFIQPNDTTIFIGDTLKFLVSDEDSLSRKLNFNWSPTDYILTCSNCKNPVVLPLQTTTFTLKVSDSLTCYAPIQFDVSVNVIEKYIVVVPDAFTPNADNINDIIKVDGKGIKKFIEFRIYNRWGTEVFYTDDMSIGWDGTYKGKLQNMDSYAYVIKAEMWDDNVITKKGTFSLLR